MIYATPAAQENKREGIFYMLLHFWKEKEER